MLKDILAALRSIEGLLADILMELRKRKELPLSQPAADSSPDKGSQWMMEGIDNIMSYQAGKKREGDK